ncbi:MAG: phage holin family protein [Micrococcaceae bacterium]
MRRLLIRAAIYLATAALGLGAAALLFQDFRLTFYGFLTATVIFAVAQTLFTPILLKLIERYASALISLIGLLSTWVALFVATLFTGGLQIRGLSTWIAATVVVWVVTAVGSWLLPLLFLKEERGAGKRGDAEKGHSAASRA